MAPSNKDAYGRLLVLKGVIIHAIATPPLDKISETYSSRMEGEKCNEENKKQAETVIHHLKELGAWKYASPKEVKFLQSYGYNIDRQAHIDAFWRKEGVLMLMWAFSLRKTWPAIDQEANPEMLKTIPEQKITMFSKSPEFRARQEIAAKRDLIEAWHWRVRTRQIIEQDRPFPAEEMNKLGFNSYDDIVRFSARNHYKQGDLPEIIEEDYVFFGKPFRSLSSDEYQTATSIVMERHFALNWLSGKAPGDRWDETPTPT